jgi:hypothetical protein
MTDINQLDEATFQELLQHVSGFYSTLFHGTSGIQGGGDVQLIWQRAYVAAALAHAAEIAIDAGLSAEQFAGFAFKAYEHANQSAPRFG